MKNKFLLFVFLLFLLFSHIIVIFPEKFYLNYNKNEKFQIIIKGNYKIYLNDKYQGLETKEIKALLTVKDIINDKIKIDGQLFHYDKSVRDKNFVGILIDKSEECEYEINKQGEIAFASNIIFPPLQNLPYFPETEVSINDVYENLGKISLILFNNDSPETMQILIKTKYSGNKNFLGKNYSHFEMTYEYIKPVNSINIINGKGLHKLELFFDNDIHKIIFIKDNFTDEFTLNGGNIIKRDGFILYFYKNIRPLDNNNIKKDLTKKIDENLLKDIDVKEKKEGLSVTIKNLKFKSDSAELLDSEKFKLDEIYNILSAIKDRSFLIVGHTALAGTKESQIKLSFERAKSIANLLIKKGLSESNVYYTGKGADEPVSPNDTEENMQKNRRVEIIILED